MIRSLVGMVTIAIALISIASAADSIYELNSEFNGSFRNARNLGASSLLLVNSESENVTPQSPDMNSTIEFARSLRIPREMSLFEALAVVSKYNLYKIDATIPERIGEYNSSEIGGIEYTFKLNSVVVPELAIVVGEANNLSRESWGTREVFAFNVKLTEDDLPSGIINPINPAFTFKEGFCLLELVPKYVIKGRELYEFIEPEIMTANTSFNNDKLRYLGEIKR
ncbi:MAG: hypothetical protein HPY61_13440 [Methanotrichaceae archaeon]|nr:hypothetical protein [Methanotrichaceae archaeon]